MAYKLNGREVEIEVSGYGDECMIDAGSYTDDGTELTAEECDELMNAHGCEIAQGQEERRIDEAYDRMNDR